MATLQELQAENKRLREENKAKQDLMKIQLERNRLLKENKNLILNKKFGGSAKVGASVGRGAVKTGKFIGRGLVKWANRIAEAERQEQIKKRKFEALQSKRKSVKKKVTKKKSSSKKRKR